MAMTALLLIPVVVVAVVGWLVPAVAWRRTRQALSTHRQGLQALARLSAASRPTRRPASGRRGPGLLTP